MEQTRAPRRPCLLALREPLKLHTFLFRQFPHYLAQKVNAEGVAVVPKSPGPAVSEAVVLAVVPSLLVQSFADVIDEPTLRLFEHDAVPLRPHTLLLAIVTVPVHEPEVSATFAQLTVEPDTAQV